MLPAALLPRLSCPTRQHAPLTSHCACHAQHHFDLLSHTLPEMLTLDFTFYLFSFGTVSCHQDLFWRLTNNWQGGSSTRVSL